MELPQTTLPPGPSPAARAGSDPATAEDFGLRQAFRRLLQGRSPWLALAPMQDVTDATFWELVEMRGGADAYWTEYTRVHATSRPEKAVVQSILSHRTGRPVVAQMMGNDPEALVRTARLLERLPVAAIELNLGCPAPVVYRKCAGGGLLRQPELLDRILGRLREAVQIPLSLKTRIGFESDEAFDRLLALYARHRPDLVIVHARTVLQGYRLPVRYDLIRRAVEQLPCPVLANGHIHQPQQAITVLRQTGARGWMIGRAAIRNPWIFSQIRSALADAPCALPTGRDVLHWIEDLWKAYATPGYPERLQTQRLKLFTNYIGEGLGPDATGFLYAIRRASSKKEFFEICHRYLDHDRPLALLPEMTDLGCPCPTTNPVVRPD